MYFLDEPADSEDRVENAWCLLEYEGDLEALNPAGDYQRFGWKAPLTTVIYYEYHPAPFAPHVFDPPIDHILVTGPGPGTRDIQR